MVWTPQTVTLAAAIPYTLLLRIITHKGSASYDILTGLELLCPKGLLLLFLWTRLQNIVCAVFHQTANPLNAFNGNILAPFSASYSIGAKTGLFFQLCAAHLFINLSWKKRS